MDMVRWKMRAVGSKSALSEVQGLGLKWCVAQYHNSLQKVVNTGSV